MFDNSALKTVCGTFVYQAPELFDNRRTMYDSRIDIWSLGVLLYYMLARHLPFRYSSSIGKLTKIYNSIFRSNNAVVLRKMILMGDYDTFGESWDGISSEAKDLVSKMLMVNSNRRIDIGGVLDHPWISSVSIISARKPQR